MKHEQHEHSHDHAGHDHHDHAGHDHHDHAGHDHAAHAHHDDAGHAHHQGAAHDHSHHDPEQFKRKFWISLILTIPTLVFSHGLQDILGLHGPRFPYSEWIPAVFGIVLFGYGGWVFLAGGFAELKARKPGMMTLISLAITVAFVYSLLVTTGLVQGMDFWWELATLITIMLLGHWIEMSAVHSAGSALSELGRLLPDLAELVEGEQPRQVPVSELRAGDTVLVRAGGSVPADAEIVEGEAEIDESLLTGESVPVAKGPGDQLVAGSISSGALTLRVTRVGEETALAGIMRMVQDAQQSKSATQLFADRAAGWLFYLALAAAAVTTAVWVLLKPDDLNFVLERVVTVLVIACPHALGLAIPLVAQLSTAIGARNGLLVRDRKALERARELQVVLFDKTGTLTEGRQGVQSISAAGEFGEDELLALAAAVERKAEHPIGKAIVAEAAARKLKLPRAKKYTTMPGRGVSAVIDERGYAVVSPRVLTEEAATGAPELVHAAREAHSAGQTVVYLVEGQRVHGLIALSDVVRSTAKESVELLQRRGIRVAMVTGDSHAVAVTVGRQLGIGEVFAEVLPAEKAEVVRSLQADGTRVAMVGDGVNDAPALAQADVGIAIGAGTDVAIASAGIVLAGSDPRGVANVVRLSDASNRTMRQNLLWATGYNVVAIPVAAGALFWAGITLAPAVGAVLMSVSTIVVALNAQLLRRVKLAGGGRAGDERAAAVQTTASAAPESAAEPIDGEARETA